MNVVTAAKTPGSWWMWSIRQQFGSTALSSEEGSVPGNENAINQLETQQTRVPTAAGSQAADHGTVIWS